MYFCLVFGHVCVKQLGLLVTENTSARCVSVLISLIIQHYQTVRSKMQITQ